MSPAGSSTTSSSCASSASTATSLVSNDTTLQSPSSNLVISIGGVEESWPSVEKAASLKYASQKQNDLNKQTLKIRFLMFFIRKASSITENDWKKIKTRQENLKRPKKKLNERKLSWQHSKISCWVEPKIGRTWWGNKEDNWEGNFRAWLSPRKLIMQNWLKQ